MKKVFEAWSEGHGEKWEAMTLATPDVVGEMMDRGLLSRSALLKFRIEADTIEEAKAVQHIKMGWPPFRPNGKAAPCPNLCGAVYYPEGSGECPNCGKIG
jgi:hypothetical protein